MIQIDLEKDIQKAFKPIYDKIIELEKKIDNICSNDELLTRQEAAKALKIKPETLDSWDRKGIMPHFKKKGGKKYWSKREILSKDG